MDYCSWVWGSGVVAALLVVVRMTHAAADHSQIEAEHRALINSGWRVWYPKLKPSHCHWWGITCNGVGHVTAINMQYYFLRGELSKLNLSSFPSLRSLSLPGNLLNGSIPTQIGDLTELTHLDLSENELTGSIPPQIGVLIDLKYLDLSGNQFTGPIPHQISNLAKLTHIDLRYNKLYGIIPPQIGDLTQLTHLDLSENQLTGSIPPQIGTLRLLIHLDLSLNKLIGAIPSSFGRLTKLTSLNLSVNQINESIPLEIGNMKDLVFLDLHDNLISEEIPSQMKNLKRLKQLSLSYNKLSGPVPPFITNNHCNATFGVSHNDLLDSYAPPVCYGSGDIATKLKFIIGMPATLFFAVLLIGLAFLWWKKRKAQSESTKAKKNGDLFCIWDFDGSIAFEDIISATRDFDITYCIGVGGYGSVYRAVLPSTKVVAVKKLHRSETEKPTYLKSFKNEAAILEQIRHRNIVKLHGYCLHNRCMFLIYEYMERGNLFCMLSNDAEAIELDWIKRVNIVKNVAYALSYPP